MSEELAVTDQAASYFELRSSGQKSIEITLKSKLLNTTQTFDKPEITVGDVIGLLPNAPSHKGIAFATFKAIPIPRHFLLEVKEGSGTTVELALTVFPAEKPAKRWRKTLKRPNLSPFDFATLATWLAQASAYEKS